METNSIREGDSKGRHTTTHRQLIMLKNGSMIIDTPGMRELGMWDTAEGLGTAFADIEALVAACRFGNCTHTTEKGCRILESVESGAISRERFDSYRRILEEIKTGNWCD